MQIGGIGAWRPGDLLEVGTQADSLQPPGRVRSARAISSAASLGRLPFPRHLPRSDPDSQGMPPDRAARAARLRCRRPRDQPGRWRAHRCSACPGRALGRRRHRRLGRSRGNEPSDCYPESQSCRRPGSRGGRLRPGRRARRRPARPHRGPPRVPARGPRARSSRTRPARTASASSTRRLPAAPCARAAPGDDVRRPARGPRSARRRRPSASPPPTRCGRRRVTGRQNSVVNPVGPEDRASLYHAALTVGANHLVTLVNEALDLLERAARRAPRTCSAAAASAALDNALRLGDAALTGPVSRGDAATVPRTWPLRPRPAPTVAPS